MTDAMIGRHPGDGATSVALTAAALARASAEEGQGATVFTRLYRDSAMAGAERADARRRAGRPLSAIDGLPVSIKDLFDVGGETTTCAAPALAGAPAAVRDATVVARLKAAGAVLVGRTNMTQFALSCLGLNPALGTPLSPWQRAEGRIAGGSSSGAAASVADGMAVAAIGSDTGGSVRVPAAFCGLVGFKPTARRIDRTGAFPLSRSLDSIGPIAASVACCAMLDAILAAERTGAPTLHRPVIGIPSTLLVDDLDPAVAAAFEAACRRLARHADLTTVALPSLGDLAGIAALGGFSTVEGWADHADLFERIGDACDPRVMDRFRAARATSVATYFAMCRLRRDIIDRFDRDASGCDAIAYPSVAILPPRLSDLADDAAYHALNMRAYRNAGVANLLDRCAISIPCTAAGAPPVGFTLMGATCGDVRLLALAERLEPVIRGSAATG
ncbi:MAG: amidase [Sphingomonas fennica]